MFDEDLFYSEEEPIEVKGQTRKLLRNLLPYFTRFRGKIIIASILLLISTVLGLFGPILLKHAIDVDIKLGSISGLARTSLIYFLLQIIIFAISYYQRIALAYVGEKTCALLKENLYAHIVNLPMKFFDKNPVGRLLTRVDSDTEAIKNLFTTSAVVLTQDLVLLLGMSVVMSIINYKLFLTILILLPPFIYAFWWFQHQVRPIYLKIRRKVAEINNYINESLQNLTVVQTFNRQDYTLQRLDNFGKEKFAQELVGMKLWYRIWFLVDFGEVLGLVIVLAIGGIWALKGLITIGTLFLFASYITRLFMPLRGLSDQLNVIQRAFASAQRMFGILETEKEEGHALASQEPEKIDVTDKVRFENIYFSYNQPEVSRVGWQGEVDSTEPNPKTENGWVLKDITLAIRNGEKVALVGMTGSGKTSIISLLLKFYIPQQGRILLNGKNIMSINNQQLRSEIGFVPQDIILFPGSVLDNLRLFDQNILLPRVKQASEQIGIRPAIENFPLGFETDIVARGINLSVGERQLLSFVRALVRNPELLILDEATSSIDPHTEKLIQDGLLELLKDRTAIIIAHRLATIQMVDRIIVIRKGTIVEQGSHQELLKKQGYYYRLYRLQYLRQDNEKGNNKEIGKDCHE